MFKRLVLSGPINILFFINFLFFGLLFLYIGPYDTDILLAGAGLTGLMMLAYFIIVKAKMGDQYIFLILSVLTSIGVVMLYRLNPYYGLRQISWYGIGVVLYFLAYLIFNWIKGWENYGYLYVAGGLILFVLTFALGTKVKGATNWIKISGFTLQPAEIIKIFYVFFIAAYVKFPDKFKNEYIFLGLIYVHIMFLVLQRDLGMAVLFYGIFISIYYIYFKDWRLFYSNFLLAIPIAVFSYFTMTHVQVRFEAWLNPWRDIAGRGYQITQSLFAIAEGGFFGVGLGLGRPDYIPEVHTDFIFSAICEELGIFGGIAVVLLYFILIYRGFKISLTIRETFKRTVALGITLTYSYQTFIIIGGVIKLIPLTGITLPFISYGGSALISGFIALGILQALSKKSMDGEEVAIVGGQ
ncbi:FtsW/RodA/SpoVE family cell cycle protein [Alkaliphilus hydrothermalis]|uniref:Cell division protein FtsW (Lipid II flippase) n=1 Tax=Alkaliphilus hydrothermalis TaxID=1482730 RepID=A0ABS2NQJ2_9FIRM|nr:FtsW/RodA/SpoVE family cell cycle protein [Alkaliphilus hydrothermalis]MBM7615111.1 cell division protein FtsW (lipid II flippase) [Alkaliphilus hydrothermalis]